MATSHEVTKIPCLCYRDNATNAYTVSTGSDYFVHRLTTSGEIDRLLHENND